uniref:Uncharacterized protein n=1 Tax=Tanacetum cinerariifolium TaxID=118510 RepID=A0A699HEV8_TANCI|nr:hypothetical protein [Tanacetum cinerariifolium]
MVVDDIVVDDEVMITGERDTDDYIFYENVDPSKGYSAMESFWQELVPDLYMAGYYSLDDPNTEGLLFDDIELLIRNRPHCARFTVAKSGNNIESLYLKTQSSYSRVVYKKANDCDVMLIELIKNNDDLSEEDLDENYDVLREEEFEGYYFNKFLTKSKLAYHKYLMSAPFSSMIMSNLIIVEGIHLNLKIPCNIGHVLVGRAYIDLDSPLYIMSKGCYNWIMTTPLEPRKDSKSPSRINNFMR